jgi:broad specificity phosphatase PhoE
MNVEVRFRGRLDVPLNDEGRREAWLAARNLRSAGITAVYSSPLGRAREVAQAICAATGVPWYEDLDRLVNLDYGDWHGLTKQEAALLDPEGWRLYREAPELAACPGGEALADAADRVVDALQAIGRRHPGESVAAVSHGVMLRLAVLRAGASSEASWEIPLPTGSAIEFEVLDRKLRVVTLPTIEPALDLPPVGAARLRAIPLEDTEDPPAAAVGA